VETVPESAIAIIAYAILVAIASVASFLTYGFDKRRAANGGRRVRERTLHLLAFAGGWPGALLAQRHFRHKTRKTPFLIAFWGVVGLHFAIVGALVYATVGPLRAAGRQGLSPSNTASNSAHEIAPSPSVSISARMPEAQAPRVSRLPIPASDRRACSSALLMVPFPSVS